MLATVETADKFTATPVRVSLQVGRRVGEDGALRSARQPLNGARRRAHHAHALRHTDQLRRQCVVHANLAVGELVDLHRDRERRKRLQRRVVGGNDVRPRNRGAGKASALVFGPRTCRPICRSAAARHGRQSHERTDIGFHSSGVYRVFLPRPVLSMRRSPTNTASNRKAVISETLNFSATSRVLAPRFSNG